LTTSRSPYIEPSWFRPGSFVAHVSLDDVTEEVFLQAEALFVDDVTLIRDNPRRILGRLMAEGKISEPGASARTGRGITGTLGDVLTGRREAVRPADGVVVSNPFGMSILDVGLLQQVAAAADAEGLGLPVRLFGEAEADVNRWDC
jgi:ornithine cyclodeaminase